jgi:hypothetical protein
MLPTRAAPNTSRTISSQDSVMNDHTSPAHAHARTRQNDVAILAAGHETGWWDDNGRPAPWPDDFGDAAAGRSNGNTRGPDVDGCEIDPENQPF